MRISILTHGASPFGVTYARAFARQGHQVEVLSLTPCRPVADVPMRVVGSAKFKPLETSSRIPYLKTIRPVRRAVRDSSPDILFAIYLSSAGIVACLSGHPHVVVSAQGSDVVTHVDRWVWRAVFRWLARRACLVHAVSEHLADVLADRVGLARDRILVCPIGVDTDQLAFVEPYRRPGSGHILNTRAHKPVYDQATFVRAMARLKACGVSFRVTFGHAFQAESTRRLVHEMGLDDRTVFLGGYTADELPGLLAAADLYVSCSRSDGTSISLLEAMSTGTFPVVSDIPANRPWVEHGRNGYLFPAGDDAAMADRLEEALARPDVRAAAASLNRQIVLDHGDVNRLTSKLLAAFQASLAE